MRFSPWTPVCVIVLSLTVTAVTAVAEPAASADWTEAKTILARIVPPQFPNHNFAVTDYGAKADGATDSSGAFAKAIEACAKAGGGRVVVPPGTFLCDGPIHLQSNINLHVSEGATIKFGADPARYLPPVLTRFEGTLLMGHSPRIYAKGATNIAITGKGTIDGNARETFALLKSGAGRGNAGELRKMGAEGVAVEKRVFGEGRWLRPSTIQPFDCTNVLIEGITVRDSTFWVVHPVLCQNVTVRGIKVDSMNANNDGCDPDSCRDVLIENCDFHTGDDAIAIKSGRDQDGWKVGRASENIVIRHCIMRSKWSALCIGSEMSGGVRNVFMEDCQVAGAASAFYFKANLDRGGLVEHVRARHLSVDDVREPLIRFETSYHGWRGENHPPSFRDFVIEDLICQRAATYGIYVEGVEAAPIRDVVVRRVKIDKAQGAVWLKRAENVRFEDVKINGVEQSATPPTTPESEVKLKMSS
jgi:polygalacturonase